MNEHKKYIVQGVFVLVGLVFLTKLFFIQIVSSDYKQAADDNIIQKIIDYPYRGVISDRNGELLVHNSPIYDLQVVPREVSLNDTLAFYKIFHITQKEFEQKMKAAASYSWVKPSIFIKQIPLEEFASIQDHLVNYSGFYITARTTRAYSKPILANALGYIGEIDKKGLNLDTTNYYSQGDYIGISGLEAMYEDWLRGKRGEKIKMVNAKGIEQGSFKDGKLDKKAVPGVNLGSTIDSDLQVYAEKLLENKVGSVVAIEPSTGEILVMTSAPSYDPNLLSGRNFGSNFNKLQKDTLYPLFNRPIMADVYPPGSIFKLIQTLIGLQENVIYPETDFECNKNLIGCHNHGPNENLIGAIRHSCNPYFYKVFRRIINQNKHENTYKDSQIGLEVWREHLLSFGMGKPLGIDLPNEKPGIIPTTAYYDKLYGKGRWKFSNIYSLAIGQGELGFSPLQIANFTTIIANRGYYIKPHLIKAIGDTNEPLPQFNEKHFTTIDRKHFDLVVDAMEKVVESGTGQYRAKLKDIKVCGKTGTVENPHGEDHSVFIAFAPKDNPQIALSVYVENAGQGARAAAAISGLLIEKYLKGDQAELYFEDYVMTGEFLY
ncbi:MAG: penicillin-binding transpeptidase domain-containing protein [Bacteroidetes bacterium]|nr:penicillin-binding transpeptidase domain-containing protein [Bacteroidota bacterium]